MATLKTLVDEITNIKNELVICHSNLKNNLVENNIDVSSSDKLLNLINKVDNLSLMIYKASIGNTDAIYAHHGWIQFYNLDFVSVLNYTSKFDGTVTMQFGLRSNNGGCVSTAEIRLNNSSIRKFETTSTHVIGLDCQVELSIKKGDIISIYTKKNSSNSSFGGEISFPVIKCTLSN